MLSVVFRLLNLVPASASFAFEMSAPIAAAESKCLLGLVTPVNRKTAGACNTTLTSQNQFLKKTTTYFREG